MTADRHIHVTSLMRPLALLLLWASVARGETPALAPVFQDAMVLQRGVEVAVWGTAGAGEAVEVTFADQRKMARADVVGNWRVSLDALAASAAPRALIVRAGDQVVRLQDVLVGDVWLAAGQSNMEWPLSSEAHAKAEAPRADLPNVRLLNLAYAGQHYFGKPFGPDVLARLVPEPFFRGRWRRCTPESANAFSAVAYYFAREVHQAIDVPIGVVHLAVGGSPAEAWVRREALAQDQTLRAMLDGNWLENEAALDDWCRQRGRENLGQALGDGAAVPGDELGPNHPFKPGFLWDAGISPLVPFPIRGVIWYQGESNALSLARVRQHERLFPLLVADWRRQWSIGELPFLYCQLSSIGTQKGYKSHHWPEFRDAQRRMLSQIPSTGMALTSDLGHPSDVHPRNKKEVGRRLALWALAKVHGQQVAFSGPLAISARRAGSSLAVRFEHADGGLQTSDGKPPIGFELTGHDGTFHPAEVRLAGAEAILNCKLVSVPTAARYAWRPYANGNLCNGADLPASTFLLTTAENQIQ